MPKYLFAYHGGSMPETPEDQAATMRKWADWLGAMERDLIDPGNPVGLSSTVFADRVEANGGANPVSGYSIVTAADHEAAAARAKGCPILESGGSVEVAEIHELDLEG